MPRRTTHLLPLSTSPHDDDQQLCGGEARMAIPPDTGTVPVTTASTHLWTAPSNPTHYAGPAPPPGQRVMRRVTLDRAYLASFPQAHPSWSSRHRRRFSQHCPTKQSAIELCLLTRYCLMPRFLPLFFYLLVRRKRTFPDHPLRIFTPFLRSRRTILSQASP